MSYAVVEYTMARLLTDEHFLSAFKDNPEAVLANLDLTSEERLSLLDLNIDDLTAAALSFSKKRKICKTN